MKLDYDNDDQYDLYYDVVNTLLKCLRNDAARLNYEEIEEVFDDAYEEIIGSLPQHLDRMFG